MNAPAGDAPLDAALFAARGGGPSFPLRNRLLRALWQPAWLLLAAWTPRRLRPWRIALLRLFGARIARRCDVSGSVRVWYPPHLVMEEDTMMSAGVTCYNMAPIVLQRGVIVSQRAHLCAGSHDIDDPNFQLVARPIVIGAGAWVAAEAFVGPGVTVGENAVVGARAVAMRDVAACAVAVGNPAREIPGRRRAPRSPRGR